MSSVQISPTPGPATIRLALLRNAIENHGVEWVRTVLFPIICTAEIRIRPPKSIAISVHNLRAYKGSVRNHQATVHLEESIVYREYAHTSDSMTIYIQVPAEFSNTIKDLLMTLGYWGNAESLAQCIHIDYASPHSNECAAPLHALSSDIGVKHLVTGLVTEFRDKRVVWDEIVATDASAPTSAIQAELFVWPMTVIEQRGGDRLLLRCTLAS